MLNDRFNLLTEHCKAVLYSGDSERDFRARMIAGLAIAMGVFCGVLIADDLATGAFWKAALLSQIPLGAIAALGCLFVRRDLNLSSLVLVGVFFYVLALVLFLSGGSLAGGFVALPVIVLIGGLICTRRVATALTISSVAVSAITMWLSTTEWSFPMARTVSPLWLSGRVSIVVSLVTLLAVLLYRDTAEQTRRRALASQDELESTNSELSRVLSEQLASAQLMFKVQQIGELIGWWYEPDTGNVHYTASQNGEFLSFNLEHEGEKQQAMPFQNEDLRELVKRRIERAEAWDDETKLVDEAGKPSWYRDSGEVDVANGCVTRVVGVLQNITSTKTLTEQLELHANYDELTGLFNRRIFWKAVEAEYDAFKTRETMSHLLFIDLDQFKLVNDTSGHLAGDRLLQIVARVLKDNVHDSDIVGRVGGDEFGLIIRHCSPSMVAQIADRLREAIELVHFHWSGETFRVGASVGVIGIDPATGNASELQQLVDAACYEAKLAGRNRVNFFEGGEEVIEAHRGEARWVQRLHDAMTHDRFELHGQLIKSVADTGEPNRYEVLLRLRDTDGDRLIPPGAFLPAAERFGLSPQIDQWVLGYLMKQLHADPDIATANRRYWVNLSGNSIGDKQFAEYLVETIRNSSLPKGMINFEITETAVIRNIETAGELIAKLRSMGCQFALDDFGSGLSSFGYLKKLPVDYLKIDGMFVREILNDEADRVFVRAIINIAQTMGIKTVAEFVENDEIYRLVEDFGVDYVQGYGVHRPEKLNFKQMGDKAMSVVSPTIKKAG